MAIELARSGFNGDRPRVLVLAHCYRTLAGVELHIDTLARALRDRFQFGVAYPVRDQVHFLNENNLRTILPGAVVPWPQTPISEPNRTAALCRIVELFRPDLIHVQHFLNWPIDLLDQVQTFGVPTIVSFHDYYAITPQLTLQDLAEPEETLTAAYSQKTFGRDLSSYLKERRQRIDRSLRNVSARIAVSAFLQRTLARAFAAPIRIVENGIEEFRPAPRVAAQGVIRFGYFGNLVPQKGWQTLIAAFGDVRQLHPGAELHVHGWFDRPPAPQPGVTYYGTYQHFELPGRTAQIDVAVIPSEFPEPFSLVLSEMWQARLPVVGSDLGALGERIVDGVNGKKFRAGDRADLERALSWFIENDDWRSWSLPRPRLAREMADEYAAIYQECRRSRGCKYAPAGTKAASKAADWPIGMEIALQQSS